MWQLFGGPAPTTQTSFRPGIRRERSIETLDVGVLSRASGLNQDVFDSVLLCPGHERPAGKFRSIVGSDLLGITTKRGRSIQQARDVFTANAKVCGDIHTFVTEVVRHREAFEAS